MAIDRALQRQWGRIGGLRLAASRDPREYTAPARQRFLERFYEGIPEDLPLEERDRRAMAARKAYFAELAIASARARKRPSGARLPT
ncbi:MAG: hypothetical protein M3472_03840 [Chloroflexota bacterium]|nr:hypothetical protein [Chloroflexota bacterium]